MLNQLMKVGWGDGAVPKLLNKTISGFAQGAQAVASVNGLVSNWSKFTVETPPTAMLLHKFTNDCRAQGACVEVTCDDKVITISRVTTLTGGAGGGTEWEAVQEVATITLVSAPRWPGSWAHLSPS